jgi:prophage regulatory protein
MEAETTVAPARRFLRMAEVEHRTGRSRTSIYRDVSEGRLPRPVKIGPRAIGWPSDVIDRWIESRIAA